MGGREGEGERDGTVQRRKAHKETLGLVPNSAVRRTR